MAILSGMPHVCNCMTLANKLCAIDFESVLADKGFVNIYQRVDPISEP